jgi:hypothetical protein
MLGSVCKQQVDNVNFVLYGNLAELSLSFTEMENWQDLISKKNNVYK